MTRALIAFLAASVAVMAQGPVPRPAPELKIATQTLSAWRGRVVLLAFISTQCGHCQAASRVFEQLSHEFAGKLLVAEVAAFGDTSDVVAFENRFGLTFPVGVSTSDAAHDFLGITRGMRVGTPQIVVIDRAGVIRAQSERLGSPMLQTPDYLRELLKAVMR